jgi:CRISPR-associated protein Cas2
MASSKGVYLVAYDIREPRRLRRVHYRLKKIGLAVQYSVFMVEGHQRVLEVHNVLNDITAKEDDVRIYQIQGRQSLWMSGKDTPQWRNTKTRNTTTVSGLFSRLIARLGGR